MGYLTSNGYGYFHEAAAQHDAAAFLRLAGQQLISGGYILTGHGEGWITATRGARGLFWGIDYPHQIMIRTDGTRVRFEVSSARQFGRHDVGPFDNAVGALLATHDAVRVQESLFGPPQGYPPPPSMRIVERQVVVTRCKFCRGHTPIDAPSCANCGAAGFA